MVCYVAPGSASGDLPFCTRLELMQDIELTSKSLWTQTKLVEAGSKVVPAAAAAVEQRSAYDGVNGYDRPMADEKTAVQSADFLNLCCTSLKNELFQVKPTR